MCNAWELIEEQRWESEGRRRGGRQFSPSIKNDRAVDKMGLLHHLKVGQNREAMYIYFGKYFIISLLQTFLRSAERARSY